MNFDLAPRFTDARRVAEMFPHAHPEHEEWRTRFIVFRAELLARPPRLLASEQPE